MPTFDSFWKFVDRHKMKDYLDIDKNNGRNVENWFTSSLKRIMKFPINKMKILVRQTRSGLYFNLYSGRKQVGHSSFHYDEGRPGSISHIIQNHGKQNGINWDWERHDVDFTMEDDEYYYENIGVKKTIMVNLKEKIPDTREYFSSFVLSLTYTINKIIGHNPDLFIQAWNEDEDDE